MDPQRQGKIKKQNQNQILLHSSFSILFAMFRFIVLVLALFAAAIFADNNFDEKYSQPLSEKDVTLGTPT